MKAYYEDEAATVYAGDCLDVLRGLPDNSVDAVCTDPPYGISFMGKQWDQPGEYGSRRRSSGLNHQRGHKDAALEAGKYDLSPHALRNFQHWCEEWATECLRILKPGGHIVAFGGARTWHRLASGIEDAGFEIRDSIAWLFGSGFPKSLDVSKAIDKAAGVEFTQRPAEGVGFMRPDGRDGYNVTKNRLDRAGDSTPVAERWQGWGTALKPAFEPIVVGRKTLTGTVAGNVLQHGTGALNIDGCRVGDGSDVVTFDRAPRSESGDTYDLGTVTAVRPSGAGRWPTNVVLDDSQAAELDRQSGYQRDGVSVNRNRNSGEVANEIYGARGKDTRDAGYGAGGGSSRFFPVFAMESGPYVLSGSSPLPTFHYEPKAPTHERPREGDIAHPTVKPLDLMRWLVRLVTPPGGTVLDPFAGSGTTAEACVIEHFKCITIEREADYLPLIVARLTKPIQVGLDFDGMSA